MVYILCICYKQSLQSDVNVELPEPKHVRAENNKIFYFDVGNNERGTFVRISEVYYFIYFFLCLTVFNLIL